MWFLKGRAPARTSVDTEEDSWEFLQWLENASLEEVELYLASGKKPKKLPNAHTKEIETGFPSSPEEYEIYFDFLGNKTWVYSEGCWKLVQPKTGPNWLL
jgi:hypothetical protein